MDFKYIRNKTELMQYIAPLNEAKVFAVDTETTGLDPHINDIRLIQIAAEGIPVLILDCFSFLPDGLDTLKTIFKTQAVKIFQNAKFDIQFLIPLGLHLQPVFDTMLAAQLLRTSGGPKQANLAALAEHYLGENLNKDAQKSDWSQELSHSQLEYAARDAEILLTLRKVMVPLLVENKLSKIAQIEFECVRALAYMEYYGIYLNTAKWETLCEETEQKRNASLETLYSFGTQPITQLTLWGDEVVYSDNYDSNPFVLKLLQKNGIPVQATAKKDLSPYRDHPLIAALTDYRHTSKSLSSFLYPFKNMIHPKTGRIHPHYGQIGAWSGRMSCWNPNIQQIPRDSAFRECFCAPAGKSLILADYSQIELRVAAQISGDKRMISAYQSGKDLHLLTASLISGKSISEVTKQDRQAAKAVNFGLIFGMGAAGLQQYASMSYGVEMSLEQASEFRDRFFKAYPGIKDWHNNIKNNPPRESRTLAGRKFVYSDNAGLTGYYNTPVQGTAADIAKKALGMINNKLTGSESFIVGIVHDEILLECPCEKAEEVAGLLKTTMESAADYILHDVPSQVDAKVSMSWAEK